MKNLQKSLLDKKKDFELKDISNADKRPQKYQFVTDISFCQLINHLYPANQIKQFNNKIQKNQEVSVSDLPQLVDFNDLISDNVEQSISKLEKSFAEEQQSNQSQPSLIRAVYQSHKNAIFISIVTLFLNLCGKIAYTYYIGRTIRLISEKSNDENQQELISSTLILLTILFFSLYLDSWFVQATYQFGVRLRMTIVGLLYKKLTTVSLTALNNLSIGKFINVVSSELTELDMGVYMFVGMLTAPFLIVASFIVVYQSFGIWSLVGNGILFLYQPLQTYLANTTIEPKKNINKFNDERIKLSTELIESIRLLQMYCWEEQFIEIIQNLRQNQTENQNQVYKIDAITRGLPQIAVLVAVIAMCSCFIFIGGGTLTVDRLYSSMFILSAVRVYGIQYFGQGQVFIVNIRMTEKRIKEILSLATITLLEDQGKQTAQELRKPFLKLDIESAYWSDQLKKNQKKCLQGIKFKIEAPSFTAIIGKIGSGKTTLLMAILKEIPHIQGQISFNAKVAYVQQEPYVFSGTIKSNIIFGKEFDQQTYDEVLEISCLKDDLVLFDNNDETLVGQRGTTLSGGQRARLSLARALYSGNEILLLDDPFSAVDSKVGQSIYEQLFEKKYLKSKIVVLVTHQVQFTLKADNIFLMDGGKIIKETSGNKLGEDIPSQLLLENEKLRRKSLLSLTDKLSSDFNDNVETEIQLEKPQKPDDTKIKNADAIFQEPKVTFETYQRYFQYAGGTFYVVKVLFLFTFSGFLVVAGNQLISNWAIVNQANKIKLETLIITTEQFKRSNINWTIYLSLLAIVTLYFCIQRGFYLYYHTVASNTKIHHTVIQKISKAKVEFFDATPVGVIINRLAGDLGSMDGGIQISLLWIMSGMIKTFIIIIFICFFYPMIFIPFIPVMLLLYYIINYYLHIIQFSILSDLRTQSPVYNEINSTMSSLILIRAYNQKDAFISKFLGLLYANFRCSMSRARSHQLLTFQLQSVIQSFVMFGIIFIVILATSFDVDVSSFGFTLLMFSSLTETCSASMQQILYLNINMANVERMFLLMTIKSQEPDTQSSKQQKVLGFEQGEVIFENVTMSYKKTSLFDLVTPENLITNKNGADQKSDQESENDVENKFKLKQEVNGDLKIHTALNQFNLEIKSNQKVGVVGRTGAGQSSIIQALFRMVEIEDDGGSISIDGQNTKQMSLNELRSRISIIPQTPIVFSGTIKRNLDPLSQYKESQIWEALQAVSLKATVKKLKDQLQTDMTLSSNVFSVGQKQLICLARALLFKNQILVLDQATSNIDNQTDAFIQKTIKEQFIDSTVITIAHRLITIADYDKIAVIHEGQVAEFDHPFLLLVKNENDTKITQSSSIFGSMVLKTGKNMSDQIFNLSRNAFLANKKN